MTAKIDNMVEATDLSVVRRRLPILHDVHLAIPRGETVAVLGPNGAGKSTLLKCLAGAIAPSCGRICWLGNDAPRSAAVRRQIGFVGHETGLYAELTPLENLVFGGRMHGVDDPHHRATALLAEAGLEPISHRPAGELSQGTRRRLAIARALVHDPPFVLLDEPFTSLDTQSRCWLQQLLEGWRGLGRTVCFASHDVEQSRDVADSLVWLNGGQIVASESTNCLSTCLRESA